MKSFIVFFLIIVTCSNSVAGRVEQNELCGDTIPMSVKVDLFNHYGDSIRRISPISNNFERMKIYRYDVPSNEEHRAEAYYIDYENEKLILNPMQYIEHLVKRSCCNNSTEWINLINNAISDHIDYSIYCNSVELPNCKAYYSLHAYALIIRENYLPVNDTMYRSIENIKAKRLDKKIEKTIKEWQECTYGKILSFSLKTIFEKKGNLGNVYLIEMQERGCFAYGLLIKGNVNYIFSFEDSINYYGDIAYSIRKNEAYLKLIELIINSPSIGSNNDKIYVIHFIDELLTEKIK